MAKDHWIFELNQKLLIYLDSLVQAGNLILDLDLEIQVNCFQRSITIICIRSGNKEAKPILIFSAYKSAPSSGRKMIFFKKIIRQYFY